MAEYTAFGAATTPMAPSSATAPSTQNTTASAVDVIAASDDFVLLHILRNLFCSLRARG